MDVLDCRGEDGTDGSGLGELYFVTGNTWSVLDNSSYQQTLSCGSGTALSVGIVGAGSLNNVISMYLLADGTGAYFAIRLQAGAQASDITGQVLCSVISQ